MQRLEVSGAVRPLYGSLGVKGLRLFGGSNLDPEVSYLYWKLFPNSPATLSADLNFFHSLCTTLWKIMLSLETVNRIQLKECRYTNVESDRYPLPHKIPPYHLHYITRLYWAAQLDPWEKNPVFSVDGLQVYITMGDTWSGWQDNGNIMDPGPNIHHIAASEVTDRQKTKFPSSGPHTWGYSTVWYYVLRLTLWRLTTHIGVVPHR